MSEEEKKFSYSDFPEDVKKCIVSAQGSHTIKFFAENPGALEVAVKLTELLAKAQERIKSNPQILTAMRHIADRVQKNPESMAALLTAQAAAMQAASSRTCGEFRKAQQELSEQYRKMGIASTQQEYFLSEIKIDSSIPDSAPVPVQNHEQANEIYVKLDCIKSSIENVSEGIDNFWINLKNMVERNEKSSRKWAWASCILSIVAIVIAIAGIITQVIFSCRAEKNDKTGELIKVVKKSHPWSGQQISAEDAKNVCVAFQAITEALQKNVQLEKGNIQLKQEIDRLQANLKKAQDDLAELKKRYNTDKVAWTQKKQKLYTEITVLKKQIEELKAELAKRPLATPVFTQEDKK